MPPGLLGAGTLAGTPRGRWLAAVPALAGVGVLAAVVLAVPNQGHLLVLRPLHRPWVAVVLGVLAAVLFLVAARLVSRGRPAAVVVLAGVLTVALCAAATGWGLFTVGFRGEIVREEVLDISPDGRFEVVRQDGTDVKGVPGTVVRIRSRSGLLSRESAWELAMCGPGVPGGLRGEFVGDDVVQLHGPGGRSLRTGFDPRTLRPAHVLTVCP
ncbi:MAG: hypothetical protein WA890_02395 [Micromonospora sp.]